MSRNIRVENVAAAFRTWMEKKKKGKDKGFIGTYVDSFIGSQVTASVVDGVNPCANLGANTSFTINLAE